MNSSADRAASSWRAVCLLGLVAWLGWGCKSSEPKAEWMHDTVTAASERVLWEVTGLALEKSGFPGGTGLEPGRLIAVSGWHVSLAPFRGKGFREQCEVRYTPAGPREYRVDVRVRREKNDDLVKPLDITYADWKLEPDNPEHAQIVLQYIKSMLGSGFDVGGKRAPAAGARPRDQ